MSEAVLTMLEQVRAIVSGSHIVYTSGRHGSSYVNKDALFPHVAATSAVCERIATHFAQAEIDVVAGPTVGGVILAQWVAHHLGTQAGRPVLAVYAEEDTMPEGTKQRVFRRGYNALLKERRVLVVEDILTTGGSARMVVDAVGRCGGTVLGVGVLCNRGGITAAALAVPALLSLTTLPLESWPAADCPLCAAGVPINTEVGKGAAFLTQHPQNGA